ncbi:MAG: VOC family protein, partial [Candidatus Thermochlorobacter sp.]
PLLDHITIRTTHVERRAEEFLSLGFIEDINLGIVEYENWWAKVYRYPGLPAVFIDQAFEGERGAGCVIPKWVETFGDEILHHVAVNVDDIEKSIAALERKGIEFAGEITGEPGSALRQIFTKPEMKHGMAFTVLELTERHWGYSGFRSLQANTLMESTRT